MVLQQVDHQRRRVSLGILDELNKLTRKPIGILLVQDHSTKWWTSRVVFYGQLRPSFVDNSPTLDAVPLRWRRNAQKDIFFQTITQFHHHPTQKKNIHHHPTRSSSSNIKFGHCHFLPPQKSNLDLFLFGGWKNSQTFTQMVRFSWWFSSHGIESVKQNHQLNKSKDIKKQTSKWHGFPLHW